MSVEEPVRLKRHPFAVSCRGRLRRPLTLPVLFTAILLAISEHEELGTGHTAAPKQRGYHQEGEHRTREGSQHGSATRIAAFSDSTLGGGCGFRFPINVLQSDECEAP